jgi:hypothetical protein
MERPTHDSFRAKFARRRHPGYSWCFRCGMPWACVKEHTTPYGPELVECFRALDLDIQLWVITGQVGLLGAGGCFALCDKCWSKLTIEEREPYYWKLLAWWDSTLPVSEEKAHWVIAACREGL